MSRRVGRRGGGLLKGRRRAAEGSRGRGGSRVGARRSAAAVSLRVRAGGLSLAVRGDRGREKEMEAGLSSPFEVAVAIPLPGEQVKGG